MSEERIMILTMLQEGKITSEEATKLLNALDEAELKEYEKFTSGTADTSNYDSKDKEYKKTFEEAEKKIKEKLEKKSKEFEKWSEDFGEQFGQKFEKWGEDFGEQFSQKFDKLGSSINEGAESFADKIFDFIDGIVDKGSFRGLFGEYDTITEHIEKDISDSLNPSLEFQAFNGKITLQSWDKNIISVKAICKLKKGSYTKDNPIYDLIIDEEKYIFKPRYKKQKAGISLEVFIPKKHYERIFLFTSNGKLEVKKADTKELLLETSNASIRLNDIQSDRINACTKNGRIAALDINSKIFDVDTNNGSIDLCALNTDQANITTSNGKISAAKITSDILNLTTSNSQITVYDCNLKHINCNTSNSSIKVVDIATTSLSNVDLNTSNGKIELYFSDKNAIFNLEAQTSMGHINIDIPNLVYTLNNQQNLGNKRVLAHSANYSSQENSVNVIASTLNGSINIGC